MIPGLSFESLEGRKVLSELSRRETEYLDRLVTEKDELMRSRLQGAIIELRDLMRKSEKV